MSDTNNLQSALDLREQLIQHRSTLMRSVLELDEEVGRVKDFIDAWHHYAEMNVCDLRQVLHPLASSVPPAHNPRKQIVATKVLNILNERRIPLKTRELLAALQEKGVIIYGQNPRSTLGTILSRMPSVVKRTADRRHWTAT